MALSFLRRHAKSRWIKVLLLTVAASFIIGFGAFAYVSRSMNKNSPDGQNQIWFAKVDGVPIDLAAMSSAVRYLENRYKQMLGDAADQMLAQIDLPTQALNQMINERVIEILAKQLGLVVSDTELAQNIYRIPAFQVNGRFDRQRYIQLLHRNHMVPSEFEAEQRRELLSNKLRHLIFSTVKISDGEVFEEWLGRNDKVSLNFVKLPAKQIEQEITFTDEEINVYFEANRDKFHIPETRKVDTLTVDPEDYLGDVEISEAEIDEYYNKNIERFSHEEEVKASHILIKVEPTASPEEKDAARAKTEDLLKQLQGGADFATLAKVNSDDPGSKNNGGDLGWFGRGKMVPAFDDTAFSLQPGELSGVVETNFGFHIIKVEDQRPQGVQPLDEVSDGIKTTLEHERAQELAMTKAKELRTLINKDENLMDFGKERDMKVATSSFFALDTPVPGMADGFAATRMAFSMAEGEISEPISGGGVVYLMKLTHIVKEHEAALDEVKERVRADMRKTRMENLLKEKAAGMVTMLREGQSLEAVAKAYGLEVENTGLFTRQNASIPRIGMAPALLAASFELTPEQPLLPEPFISGNNAIVGVLDKREKPDDANFSAEKEDLRDELKEQRAQITLQAWMEQARKSIKVVTNEEAMQALRARAKKR
ncbi:MAG TPA: peptidylprolyl isomerase [bacterium]|nr:peptidylprolyl isomerase [bacterium]